MTRAAELGALEVTADDVKDSMTPLLEVLPRPRDADGEPRQPLAGHLDEVAARLARCWGRGRPVFIDVAPLVWGGDVDAAMVVRLAAEAAAAHEVAMVPVTTPGRPPAFQEAVAAVTAHDPAICVRLDADSFGDPLRVRARIRSLLRLVGVTPSQGHLVVDLQDSQSALARTMYAMAPLLEDWGAVTLASGAFPPSLGQLREGDIDRDDWALWQDVRSATTSVDEDLEAEAIPPMRMPAFGDYGVVAALRREPVPYQPVANLRYTTDACWVITRGHKLSELGNEQAYDLCRIIAGDVRFCGRSFSWGDEWIFDRAHGKRPGPGNASTWLKVGLAHHFAFVVRQLASLGHAA